MFWTLQCVLGKICARMRIVTIAMKNRLKAASLGCTLTDTVTDTFHRRSPEGTGAESRGQGYMSGTELSFGGGRGGGQEADEKL